MKKGHNSAAVASEHLRAFIQRIEKLEEEKAEIALLIKDVFAEAKAQGFDNKTMRQVIRLRKMTQEQRDEEEALIDIYKAALGMLSGTPLGEAAIRRLNPPKDEPEEGGSETQQSPYNEPDPTTIEEARAQGKKAAEEGKPVTDNPFPARDPRRAAWDEEWCRTAGNDGMELPDAWRRSAKKKPDAKKDDE